ncbi:MAG TPA: hypothetical protein VGG48_02350 [Rhizomicrobium sp.]|jgi:hypothetical protein
MTDSGPSGREAPQSDAARAYRGAAGPSDKPSPPRDGAAHRSGGLGRKLVSGIAITLLTAVYIAYEGWSVHKAVSSQTVSYDEGSVVHILLPAGDTRSTEAICQSYDIPPDRYCRTSGPCRATSSVDEAHETRTIAIVLRPDTQHCP